MHLDPPPRLRSPGARWLATLVVVLVTPLLLAVFAQILGPRSLVFAFNLHFVLMAAATGLDQIWRPRLAGPRFDVSAAEVRVYRRLGVIGFMRLLQRVGWTKAMRDPKVFDGTRGTLASYEQATRHGEHAHTWLFVVVLAPMLGAAVQGWWDAVLWLALMNVLFHLYPVMLQRTQRARLRALLRRMGELSGAESGA